MRYVILGQPRTGKTTLAEMISNKTGYPVFHTDEYRRKFGYHCPHHGFPTEIDINYQYKFYKVLDTITSIHDDCIIEGSAIYPADVEIFNPDRFVLLSRVGITEDEMLYDCRSFDPLDSWTSKRDDTYLLKLFYDYLKYAKEWEEKYSNMLIDTRNFEVGLQEAFNYLVKE